MFGISLEGNGANLINQIDVEDNDIVNVNSADLNPMRLVKVENSTILNNSINSNINIDKAIDVSYSRKLLIDENLLQSGGKSMKIKVDRSVLIK
ncbi:hypothetical protein D3C81_2108610 [compost metagenome]